MKLVLLGLRDLDNDVVYFSFKKMNGLLRTLEEIFNKFDEYGIFEAGIDTNQVSYDKYYDLMSNYEYFHKDGFNLHVIKNGDILTLIFYLKTVKRDELVKEINNEFEFIKKTKIQGQSKT